MPPISSALALLTLLFHAVSVREVRALGPAPVGPGNGPRAPPVGPGPLAAAVPACLLLGRRLLRVDFSLVAVFSALFVAIEGVRRLLATSGLDPAALFGTTPDGLVLAGAIASFANLIGAA